WLWLHNVYCRGNTGIACQRHRAAHRADAGHWWSSAARSHCGRQAGHSDTSRDDDSGRARLRLAHPARRAHVGLHAGPGTPLPGVRTGRRIQQAAALPAFVLDESCPVTVVREFLGGLFGADGHAPALHRWGKREEEATLEPPAYSQSTIAEHVEALKQVLDDITRLL